MPLEDLSPYDRATVHLWARGHEELSRHTASDHLIEAAVHAVLAGLRRYQQPNAIFKAYEVAAAADFALIRSLVQRQLSDETLWKVHDAAFHLRWTEITGSR